MPENKSFYYKSVKKNFPTKKTRKWSEKGSTLKYWKALNYRLNLQDKNIEINKIPNKYEYQKKQIKKRNANDVKEHKNILDILRSQRNINVQKGKITQRTRYNYQDQKLAGIFPSSFEEVKYLTGEHNNFDGLKEELKKCDEIIENMDYRYKSYQVIIEYGLSDEDGEYEHVGIITIGINNIDNLENDIGNYFLSQNFGLFCVGYNCLIIPKLKRGKKQDIFTNYLNDLKAYSPNVDPHYHKMTQISTTKDKICIYETYLYLYIDKESIKNKSSNTYLLNEPIEIQDIVRKGELINFCRIKSLELEQPFYIEFYKPDPLLGIIINGEEITEITDPEIFNNNKVFLYDSQHVAPRLENINKYKSVSNEIREHYTKILNKNNDKSFDTVLQKNFILRPTKPTKRIISKIYAYDIETYKEDENGTQKPFCICMKEEKGENKSFYGENVIIEFCDYLDTIKTETYMNKNNPKKKTEQILIYGFNNSRFDNIFIFNELFNRNQKIKYVIDNGYKYIKYHNIRIYDMNLYYNGSLESVAKSFNLDTKKDIFPYSFPSKDNLNYVGEVPEEKYFNNHNDYSECLNTYKDNNFDLKQHTIKYCLNDCEITLKLALYHLKNCVGKINNKPYDVRLCSTAPATVLKMFTQTSLSHPIYGSTEKQQVKEKQSYFGGRTEVFKKSFESKNKQYLSYNDINSSYASSMLDLMPSKYIKTLNFQEQEETKFEDFYLYRAKSEYIGNDEFIIPNLLIRNEKNDIVALKNTDYNYHWGNELNEAVRNNFKITINEVNEYEGEYLFKDFITPIYNEKVKAKKENNTAKSQYNKSLLTSLYGKFGQKQKPNNKICRNIEELSKVANDENNKIKDYEFLQGDDILLKYSSKNDNQCIGSLVRLSSYISACARSKLSKIMRIVGHKHIYYCDTDSILIDVELDNKFVSDSELGKFKKVNCDVHNEPMKIIQYYGIAPKCYSLVCECGCIDCKAKGQPKKLLNIQDYKDLNNNVIESKELVNDHMFIRKLDNVKIISQSRKIQKVYNKRKWNGNDSTAFNDISEWKNI